MWQALIQVAAKAAARPALKAGATAIAGAVAGPVAGAAVAGGTAAVGGGTTAGVAGAAAGTLARQATVQGGVEAGRQVLGEENVVEPYGEMRKGRAQASIEAREEMKSMTETLQAETQSRSFKMGALLPSTEPHASPSRGEELGFDPEYTNIKKQKEKDFLAKNRSGFMHRKIEQERGQSSQSVKDMKVALEVLRMKMEGDAAGAADLNEAYRIGKMQPSLNQMRSDANELRQRMLGSDSLDPRVKRGYGRLPTFTSGGTLVLRALMPS